MAYGRQDEEAVSVVVWARNMIMESYIEKGGIMAIFHQLCW